jgi:hypothetical protein
MNVGNLFDDAKKVCSDKDTIKTLNLITDKQVQTILELENKIISLEREKNILNDSIIVLKKKLFDIEIQNKVLAERVLELDNILKDSIKNTPVPSSIDLENLEKKKLKVIQERLNQKRTLYSSLRSARREILEKSKKVETEQQV